MFLYFAPNAAGAELFDYAFTNRQQRQVFKGGPNGGGGYVFFDSDTWKDNLEKVGVFPVQRWFQVPESDCYVGWYEDCFDVERLKASTFLPGHTVQLGDGRRWDIPKARAWHPSFGFSRTLPQSYGLDEKGNWQSSGILEDYAELWRCCEEVHAMTQSEDDVVIKLDDEMTWCATALQCNYRIRRWEIAALKLLNDNTKTQIILAVMDFVTVKESVKKKDLA